MKRFALMHDCPLFSRRAPTPTSTARSRSADGMTTNGSLPPSSSTVGLICEPAIEATELPAGPEPVSVARAHSVCLDLLVGEPAVGVFGVEAAAVSALLHLLSGGCERFAHLRRHHPRDRLEIRLELVCRAAQPAGAVGEARQPVRRE